MGIIRQTSLGMRRDPDTIRIVDWADSDLSHYFEINVDDTLNLIDFLSKIGDFRFRDVDDSTYLDTFQITGDVAASGIVKKTSNITNSNIFEIQATGTYDGTTVTVAIDYIHLDLDAIVLNDAAANAITLQGIDIDWNGLTATAVTLSNLTSITLEHPVTGAFNAEKGISIAVNKTAVANGAIGLEIARNISGDLAVDVAFSNFAVEISQVSTNDTAGDFDLTDVAASGIMKLQYSHTDITALAKTDDDLMRGTALLIDIDAVSNHAEAKLIATPRAIDITYTMTETLGQLRMADTDIFRITPTIPTGLSSAAGFQLDIIDLTLDGVILNDVNITFKGINIDASGLTNTASVLAGLLCLTTPDDSNIDTALVITADGTTTRSTVALMSSRDLTGTLDATPSFTNYSVILGQEVAHTITDTIVTHDTGILQLVLNHDTDMITTSPDVFSATALNIVITADADDQAAGTGADLDVSARAIDISYTLVETAGILRMAASDIFRITATIPNGLSSAGGFRFDMVELNADAVVLNDANITLSGIYIDASGMTLTAGAAAYGMDITMPTLAGVAFERAALLTTDGVNTVHLSNGSMGVSALGISEEKYYWCEDFDQEAAAVTLDGGLHADEWTFGGNVGAAGDVTYIAGAGGIIQVSTTAGDDQSTGAYWIVDNVYVDSNPIFEVRFRVNDIVLNQMGCLIGLTETVNILDINGIAAVSDDIVCIGMNSDLGNPENVRLWMNDTGGAETVVDLGVALTADIWCTVRVDCTDRTQMRVWINNTGGAISADDEIILATVGGGTIQATIALIPFMFAQCLDAGNVEHHMEVDYIKIWQDRS